MQTEEIDVSISESSCFVDHDPSKEWIVYLLAAIEYIDYFHCVLNFDCNFMLFNICAQKVTPDYATSDYCTKLLSLAPITACNKQWQNLEMICHYDLLAALFASVAQEQLSASCLDQIAFISVPVEALCINESSLKLDDALLESCIKENMTLFYTATLVNSNDFDELLVIRELQHYVLSYILMTVNESVLTTLYASTIPIKLLPCLVSSNTVSIELSKNIYTKFDVVSSACMKNISSKYMLYFEKVLSYHYAVVVSLDDQCEPNLDDRCEPVVCSLLGDTLAQSMAKQQHKVSCDSLFVAVQMQNQLFECCSEKSVVTKGLCLAMSDATEMTKCYFALALISAPIASSCIIRFYMSVNSDSSQLNLLYLKPQMQVLTSMVSHLNWKHAACSLSH